MNKEELKIDLDDHTPTYIIGEGDDFWIVSTSFKVIDNIRYPDLPDNARRYTVTRDNGNTCIVKVEVY